MISSLATTFFPSFGSSFTSESKALASPANETVKAIDDTRSPLVQMSEFFASIDSGIIKLVNIAKQSLGLDKESLQLESRIADIMASDLALEEKDRLVADLKGRDANIEGQDTDTAPGEKPEKIDFIESLKKAFDDLTNNQTIGELGKIFLFATGALAIANMGEKFNKEIQGILKYFNEKIIPGFKELDEDIRDSDTGYLGLGGAISASFYRVMGAFGRLVKAGSVSALKFVDDLILNTRKLFVMPTDLLKMSQLSNIQTFIKSITGPGSFLGKIGSILGGVGKGLKDAALFVAKFPGIAQILGLTGAVAKFLGPIGLIVQGIVGVVGGLINAVKILNDGGNVVQALGGFVEGFFDAVIGATANLIFDILGFVVKKLGFEDFGQKLQDMDFSLDSIITGVRNAIFSVLNSLIKVYNKINLGFDDIELYEMKESKVAKKARQESTSVETQLETNKTINQNKQFFSSEVENKDLVIDKKETNSMAMKTEILKSTIAATEQLPPSQKGSNVYMDNKQVTGGTTVNNNKNIASNQRVETTDRATRELNVVYGYATA